MHQMADLKPTVRVSVVVAILLCTTLGFVSMTGTEQTAARFFFGGFDLVIAFALIYEYRKEAILARDHIIVGAVVTDIRTGRRGGRRIKYKFVALNGLQYRGESDYWGRLSISLGSDILVLYSPLQPTINQPLKQFLFYSFQPCGS